ncbi:SufE family protein [Aliivibrio kagoshimensis]|uniref:SufE family protein n=1 Tax=Aliivibrio kagoshimensis TaxID=2910230 RepID=UPI003D14BBE8
MISTMTPEKVTLNFRCCVDWEEKYLYLIELGERFCTLSESEQIDIHRLHGCQSRVWVVLNKNENVIELMACSDSVIVNGLLALIVIAYDKKSSEQVLEFDLKYWFEQLELEQHLTPTRAIGIAEIVKQIQLMSDE